MNGYSATKPGSINVGTGAAPENNAARARMIVATAVGIPEKDLPLDAAIGQWGPWDSLAHMRIVLALEDDLGVALPMEQIVEIGALLDIERLLLEHGKV